MTPAFAWQLLRGLPAFVVPLVLVTGIVLLSFALRLLSLGGAIAAAVLGFVLFGLGGWEFGVPLLAFFLSSSLLSRMGTRRKAAFRTLYDKGDVRDAGQVLANGGVAGLLAFLFGIGHPSLPPRNLVLLAISSLAAVNADTWATEAGGLSRARPFLISTLRQVTPGTSGAVSLLGLAASLAGSFFVVGCAWAAWPSRSPVLLWRPDLAEVLSMGWAGFVAAFGDSVLGAGLQAQYRCGACGSIVESRSHCGRPAVRLRGWRWVTNDVVNFATSVMGAIFAAILLTSFANPK
jgi:Predicted membrane protein